MASSFTKPWIELIRKGLHFLIHNPVIGLSFLGIISVLLGWYYVVLITIIGLLQLGSYSKLTEKNKIIDSLFSFAPDSILVVDKSGRITNVNEQSLLTFGYTRSEIIGKSVESLMPERYRRTHGKLRNNAFHKGDRRNLSSEFQFNVLSKDKKEVPVEISLNYFETKEGKMAMVTLRDISNRIKSDLATRRNEEILNKAQQIAHLGCWEWDIKQNHVQWSNETYRIFGLDRDTVSVNTDTIMACIHEDDRKIAVEAYESALHQNKSYEIEHRIVRPNGEIRMVLERGEISRNDVGEAISMVGSIHDITEMKIAENALRLAENVFRYTTEAILVMGSDFRILRTNRAFSELTGIKPNTDNLEIDKVIRSEHHDDVFYHEIWCALQDTGMWEGEVWMQRKNAEVFPSWHKINAIHDQCGSIVQYIDIFSDITEKKRSEESIHNLAQYDQLTNLPNRFLFRDRLQHALQRAQRANSKVGLMFIDLDRFKSINDTLGHHVGDELLTEVAKRITISVRKQDTVSRFGGDEFTVILEDLKHAEDAATVANKILESLGKKIIVSGYETFTGGSIGISIYPDDSLEEQEMVKNSDMAMYEAKKQGRNCFHYYSEALSLSVKKRYHMENKLRQAIQNNELEVYYQPQVDLDNGKLVGAEALVRWNDPENGLVPPNDFIPFAEETGLIEDIGRWVLGASCRQAIEWQKKGFPPLRMTVNVAGYQIMNGSIVAITRDVLNETQFPAHCLELEITEGFVMENPEKGISTLNALRELGVSLAIDDFGTGYSSLSYLKRLPIDRLKIDRSFVMDIPHDKDDKAIVSTIIAMAKNLGLSVIAEGVESEGHIRFLIEHGCTEMQGFYFSKPVPASEFEQKIMSQFEIPNLDNLLFKVVVA